MSAKTLKHCGGSTPHQQHNWSPTGIGTPFMCLGTTDAGKLSKHGSPQTTADLLDLLDTIDALLRFDSLPDGDDGQQAQARKRLSDIGYRADGLRLRLGRLSADRAGR